MFDVTKQIKGKKEQAFSQKQERETQDSQETKEVHP